MIECKICNKFFGNLNNHLKYIHKISGSEYKTKFPGSILSVSWSLGRNKYSDIRLKKMSDKLKTIKHSKERNDKVRNSHIGKKRSEQHKESIRKGLLFYYKNNPGVGEIKNKIMYEGLRTISRNKKMNRPETMLFNLVKNVSWFLPVYNSKVTAYYIDVAINEIKVGFECDGEQWHIDKLKDIKRDFNLYQLGWRIYRFPSQMIFKQTSFVEEQIQKVCSGYNSESE